MSTEKKDEPTKAIAGKTGMFLTAANVLFVVSIYGVFTKWDERNAQRMDEFRETVLREQAIDTRLSSLESFSEFYSDADIIGRLANAEAFVSSLKSAEILDQWAESQRKTNKAFKFSEDWPRQGKLPDDLAQNRKIDQLQSDLTDAINLQREICQGLRDREPGNGWPPCTQAFRTPK